MSPAAAPAAGGGACGGAELRSGGAGAQVAPPPSRRSSAPCGPARDRLCAAPGIRDGRSGPAPLFRFCASSGQVWAVRGARTCHPAAGAWDPRAPAGRPGQRREMKYLKPRWSDGGGLLHLTILLSLAGLHLDLDLDLYLLLPPLRHELLLWGGQTGPAYALSPFPASGGWGRAGHLHPKGREPDPAAEPEGQLLREVRTLGVPFIPRTHVDAWLVHNVVAGDTDGAHGPLGAAAASSAGGVGASADGGSQAPLGGGGDPRAAPSSPLAAGEEEKSAAEPTAQVPDASGRASQVTGERGRERGAGRIGREPARVGEPGEGTPRWPSTPRPWVAAGSRAIGHFCGSFLWLRMRL